jgi:hypothetical protein
MRTQVDTKCALNFSIDELCHDGKVSIPVVVGTIRANLV